LAQRLLSSIWKSGKAIKTRAIFDGEMEKIFQTALKTKSYSVLNFKNEHL